jgi:para-aminobenzoate synthetase component 1
MLNWVSRFNIFCLLDSCGYAGAQQPTLLAVGAKASIRANGADWSTLQAFHHQHRDWIFGHLSFELHQDIYAKSKPQPDPVGFQALHFFVPEYLISWDQTGVRIGLHGSREEATRIWQEIQRCEAVLKGKLEEAPRFEARFSREAYIQVIDQLKAHIHRGDCYEINFCQSFFATAFDQPMASIYERLTRLSPNPFSAFYRVDAAYLACASPERYLRKSGSDLYSAPIKGTIPRVLGNEAQDRAQQEQLRNSPKERAENIMVVDLVRNDLSRVCRPGSVKVAELCGIYPFPQVHHMISTVTGKMEPGADWTNALAVSFPMGSMTGAPKKRVLELIADYERTPRGLFSGALGYVDPEGNFDFNVVIRSLLYNAETGYLSYHVGSGITHYCDAVAEYEECNWKASAIRKIWDP